MRQSQTYEHLAHFVMINTDIQAIHDVQCRFINFRDDRVVGIRRRMNYPQAVLISVEINDVIIRTIKHLSAVDCLKDFRR